MGFAASAALTSAFADDHAAESEVAALPVAPPVSFTSEHRGRFGGETVSYIAKAGETHLKNEAGDAVASFFSFSYVKKDAGPDRPVTFVFNGGPGSASVWLHMGMLGPQRVVVASDADEDDGAAPYEMVANPESPLDLTDLVFIDPIGTGWSRTVGEGDPKDYWSQSGDTESISEFMRQWIREQGRWNAPKYIVGESFGTMRAVQIAHHLTTSSQHNMALNGLALISNALDYEGSTSVHDNFYSYVTYLPTMAATSHYHGVVGEGESLEDWMDEARAFAGGAYATALLRGQMLSASERREVAETFSDLTGLSTDYILRSDLRVLKDRYRKEILRDKGVAIGSLDSRYMVDEADDVAERPSVDPASASIGAAYASSFMAHITGELDVEMERPYNFSSSDASRNWIYRPNAEGSWWEPSYVNVARKLSDAMRVNKDLDVWVANGIYDLVTPFFDAEMTFARHGIPAKRVSMTYYEAGHMMYVHEPAREALMKDMRAFLEGELPKWEAVQD
nr:hypothetical protein [Parvularcula mediterranea]